MAIKLPTTINNKSDWNDYIDSIEDPDIRERLRKFAEKYGKTEIKTFKLPLINIYSKGIPKELKKIMDIDRVIKDNCIPLYMILNSLGFYLKKDMKVLDYIENDNKGELCM
jgi:hypothetical protein